MKAEGLTGSQVWKLTGLEGQDWAGLTGSATWGGQRIIQIVCAEPGCQEWQGPILLLELQELPSQTPT